MTLFINCSPQLVQMEGTAKTVCLTVNAEAALATRPMVNVSVQPEKWENIANKVISDMTT